MQSLHKKDISISLYFKIFLALIFLTILTFIQPYIINETLSQTVILQMIIAFLKSFFIVAYYMHLKYESKLFKMIVLVALVTLSIFFIITATDAIFRDEDFDLFK